MLIDVIIPSYMPDEYFYDCLKSIESQTLDFNFFKVTIVINGSEKEYLIKVKKWLKDFNFNYEVLFIEKGGVSNARNYGLDNTNNEFVCFLDDDDLISPNFLQSLYEKCPKNGISVSNVFSFKDNLKDLERYFMTFDNQFEVSVGWKHRQIFSSVCAKLIPRHIISNTRFDVNLTHGEDSIFMFVISKSIKNIFSTQTDCIYYRRIRPNSATTVKKNLYFHLRNFLKQLLMFSSLYFKEFTKYNFIFFISRILGVSKNFISSFK